jgi:putative peptidoglycan lipid II flippase
MTLGRAAVTVGGFVLLSRISGFVRDTLTAALLGAGPMADAFFVSFKLANFLRRMFGEGAFNAGFVPVLARTIEAEGEEVGRHFARQAFSVLAVGLLGVVLVVELIMPWFIRALAPGFVPGSLRFDAAISLTRIAFPYILFICLVALVGGVLNSIGRFAAAASVQILLNLILIAFLLAVTATGGDPAHALAWGVAVAGVVQLAWVLVAAARAGMPMRFVRPRITPRIRRLGALVFPGALGAGVAQMNLLINTWFASTLPEGAPSYLFYADRLNQLPLGVVGVALGTALLPLLSRQLQAGAVEEAGHALSRAIETALLLTLPAAVALIVVAQPIVRVLFERGAFDAADTVATAGALAAFSAGLPAYVLSKVLAPAFFAREDTRTPVRVAVLCVLANIGLIVLLIGPLAHVGIALATAISNWLNAILLGVMLWRGGDIGLDARLRHRAPRLLASALVMGAVLWAMPQLAPQQTAAALLLLLATGGVSYLAAVHLIGGADARDLLAVVRGRPDVRV